eukprot:CAMPEP_0204347176 /NCGR_PEP_ID=MMETSP0469-20131031/27740_1 /ASSEMBLY_ACC=CAM_ASM_000384 /TAXON_ID=2969 /ORGANISM="Oxyrrhis marina" /LENGTH=104 /DNA_ID=CAMNT_0051332929 /DNA_START=982 /DNA_END=1296 /DNA_ORIENTATION=-
MSGASNTFSGWEGTTRAARDLDETALALTEYSTRAVSNPLASGWGGFALKLSTLALSSSEAAGPRSCPAKIVSYGVAAVNSSLASSIIRDISVTVLLLGMNRHP